MEAPGTYKQRVAEQLKEWSARMTLLEARLDTVSVDLRVRYAEELHELRARHRVVAAKMMELGKSADNSREPVRETAEKICDEFNARLTEAQSRFR